MGRWHRLLLALAALAISVAPAPPIRGADEEKAPPVAGQLAQRQRAIAEKYARLDALLQKMAELEASSNPRRAALLKQAYEQSRKSGDAAPAAGGTDEHPEARLPIAERLKALVDLLQKEQFRRAMAGQEAALQELQALLRLLESENRSDRVKSDQERVREYLKEVERLLRLQRSVQGRTEGGAATDEAAKEQGQVADRTGQLAKKIQQSEEGDSGGTPKPQTAPAGDGAGKRQGQPDSQGKGEPGEKPGAEKPADQPRDADAKSESGKDAQGGQGKGQPGKDTGKPGQGDGKPGEGQEQGKSGKPTPGKSQGQGQGQDGKPADGQGEGEQKPESAPEQGGNPARKRVQAAEERMRQAQKKLEDAQRQDAVAEQEKAKEELEKAKAELEKILRQLREEEVERVLALLESRFRKMLEMQLRIYEDTVRLGKVPQDEREDKVVKQTGPLAANERKLVTDADRALELLKEEGSSVAFPETVSQMRDDMQQVADRLDRADVAQITQSIEQDIIAALEEMIAALQKAQQDREQQRQQPMPMNPSPQDQPLVDGLSELKMVRALQMRVNTRTLRYAKLLENADDPLGQTTDQDLRAALGKLAEQQERIYQITRDLVLGKNR